mmetsp:Transcript_95683/g.169877  ORF Transcript_95683/g.169877 Transcript_95683/m.169877 type:complete len:106 (-) Transcript_95683:90-407(-)
MGTIAMDGVARRGSGGGGVAIDYAALTPPYDAAAAAVVVVRGMSVHAGLAAAAAFFAPVWLDAVGDSSLSSELTSSMSASPTSVSLGVAVEVAGDTMAAAAAPSS